MWLRLADQYQSVHVPKPLTAYRVWPFSKKYKLDVLERCTFQVVERLFNSSTTVERWPELGALRGQVLAWHYSVLAKSYLRHGSLAGAFRLAWRAMSAHPAGLRYLGTRWPA
jgi:hypothetical protein